MRVKGATADGTAVVLELSAADMQAARAAAARQGIAAVEITQTTDRGRAARASSTGARFNLEIFCQELLSLLSAQLPVREALQTLGMRERRLGGNAIGQLVEHLDRGLPLSAAMAADAGRFPNLLVEMLRAAEKTSDYVPSLQRYLQYLKQERRLRDHLVGVTLYPLILLAVSFAVMLFLVAYVVPRFAQVYADMGERLPLASRALMRVGLAIDGNPIGAAVVLAGALAWCAIVWRRGVWKKLLQRAIRAVPRLRAIASTAQLARLYRTLSMLVAGGLPLPVSLDLARSVVDADLARRVGAAQDRIRRGQTMSQAFADESLSTEVAERFFVAGENSGRLAQMIDSAAEFHEDEIALVTDRVARVIGPLMMLLIGTLIGTLVVLMYLPIFQLSDAIQ
jgi:general secretion pathway protein F